MCFFWNLVTILVPSPPFFINDLFRDCLEETFTPFFISLYSGSNLSTFYNWINDNLLISCTRIRFTTMRINSFIYTSVALFLFFATLFQLQSRNRVRATQTVHTCVIHSKEPQESSEPRDNYNQRVLYLVTLRHLIYLRSLRIVSWLLLRYNMASHIAWTLNNRKMLLYITKEHVTHCRNRIIALNTGLSCT